MWIALGLGVTAALFVPSLYSDTDGPVVAASLTAAVTVAYVVLTYSLAQASRDAAQAAVRQATAADQQADLLREQVRIAQHDSERAHLESEQRAIESEQLYKESVRARIDAKAPLLALRLRTDVRSLPVLRMSRIDEDRWSQLKAPVQAMDEQLRAQFRFQVVVILTLQNFGASPAIASSGSLPFELDHPKGSVVPQTFIAPGETVSFTLRRTIHATEAYEFAKQGGWQLDDGSRGWEFNPEIHYSDVSGGMSANIVLPIGFRPPFTADGSYLVPRGPLEHYAPAAARQKERSYPHLQILEVWGMPTPWPELEQQ